ncbi:rhomboid family intramembrane serine protease [Paenibacillus sp. GCM10023252]|uniref:rhomboid family intramembrane serine protease n=1 Tax=Paenibacillus sp. GCM10023252 TaxID=3252649 RepID=UPI0036203BAD
MIFLRYESFRGYLRSYPVTSILIGLNLLYYLFVASMGSTLDGEHLYRSGAFYTVENTDPFGLEEPWRYMTSLFLHSGFEHLFYNLFALLVFAPPLERLLGRLRYSVFYLLCGVLANAFSAMCYLALEDGNLLSVGASGAIYGVYGAFLYLALLRKSWLDEGSRKTVYIILGFGVVYSILSPGINLWAHLGGALAGFLLFLLLCRKVTWNRR